MGSTHTDVPLSRNTMSAVAVYGDTGNVKDRMNAIDQVSRLKRSLEHPTEPLFRTFTPVGSIIQGSVRLYQSMLLGIDHHDCEDRQ
ncbi:hypothetical protein AWENTII_007131 [Aspergillus wentii]